MLLKTFKSNYEILNNFIEYYYEANLNNDHYIAFPHINQPSVLCKNAIINCSKNEFQFTEINDNKVSFHALNRFKKPVITKVNGTIDEFCIVFKPYGLAQFLKSNLTLKKEDAYLHSIFEDFTILNPDFFELDISKKLESIDNYLLSKLNIKKDYEIIVKALELMNNQELSISQIAEECYVCPKKLTRLFYNQCWESPVTFKQIINFRNALEKLKINNSNRLIDIAFESGYCDLAYFINSFKKLTGETPKSFFNNLNIFHEQNIYFKSVKKS